MSILWYVHFVFEIIIVMKKFTRTKEDFTCEKCGEEVRGDGFTNHCPKCLWSKHVDVNPGDRAETCGGLMEPTGAIVGGGEYDILQVCTKCGFERKNKFNEKDSFEALLLIQNKDD